MSTELRFAWRMLWKAPGFTITAVVAFALGIGATTAIFGVLYAFLLRPLPFADPAQLVILQSRSTTAATDLGVNYLDFQDWQKEARSFSEMAFFNLRWNGNLEAGGSATETLKTTFTTANLFTLLGVEPALGRNLVPADDAASAPATVLISDRLWRSSFGSDPAIVGRVVKLDGEARTVIGVMPRGFRFPSQTDLWIPAGKFFAKNTGRSWRADQAVARLRPGVSLESAQAEMTLLAQRLAEAHPKTNREIGAAVVPLREHWVGNVRGSLSLLLVACAGVLLIACANVGQLLLARAATRRGEMLVRAALGASRWQLMRQLLTESALLAFLGSVAGALGAYWMVDALAAFIPVELPFWVQITVSPAILFFAIGVSAMSAILAGALPAWQATGFAVGDALRAAGVGNTGGTRAGTRSRELLIGAQVAISLVLLVGAVLLLRSVANLDGVRPGFSPARVLIFEVNPTYRSEESRQVRVDRYARLLERLARMPEVEAVAANNSPPFYPQRPWNRATVAAADAPETEPNRFPPANFQTVSADYFSLLGIPLQRGRAFNAGDNFEATPVCIVSESLARRLWPNEDPIGRQLWLGEPRAEAESLQVVGVVGDVRHQALADTAGPDIYKPTLQLAWKQMHFLLRARPGIDPLALVPAVRREVAAHEPGVGVYNFSALENEVSDSLWQPRLRGWLVAVFSLVALVLAGAGLHGAIRLSVAQRTREIGIRMALGATRAGVVRLVLGEGLRAVMLGLGVGLIGAMAFAHLLRASLFGLGAEDPLSYAAAVLLLGMCATVALFFPVRRAARVNPMEALRHE